MYRKHPKFSHNLLYAYTLSAYSPNMAKYLPRIYFPNTFKYFPYIIRICRKNREYAERTLYLTLVNNT